MSSFRSAEIGAVSRKPVERTCIQVGHGRPLRLLFGFGAALICATVGFASIAMEDTSDGHDAIADQASEQPGEQ